jgi:hypothetical protein
MPSVHFTNLLIVLAAGLVAPLVLGFFPRVRIAAAAGLLSVAISPTLALVLVRRGQPRDVALGDPPTPVTPVASAEDRALPRAEHVTSAPR